MGIRRTSRERALQMLFYADLSYYDNVENFSLFCKNFPLRKSKEQFFEQLVYGVWEHENYINKIIERYSNNWKLHRISCVDLNILRIATFELLYCSNIPNSVSINEAVDIGKQFGTEESGAFINGILDTINIAIIKKKL